MNRIDALGVHLSPLLWWLLENSAWAAAMAVLVLGVQILFGRWLTPAWRYRLWGLVVLRMLLPAVPSSPMSLANFVRLTPAHKSAAAARAPVLIPLAHEPLTGPNVPTVPAGQTHVTIQYFEPPGPSAKTEMAPIVAPQASLRSSPYPNAWKSFVVAIWLTGAAGLIGQLLVANIRLARRLSRSTLILDSQVLSLCDACCAEMGLRRRPLMLVSDAVVAPAAAGIRRAKIIFPPGMIDSLSHMELRAVLLHELAHVRCRDVACNWLLALLRAVHWFNPAVWFSLGRLQADREIARDAMVLRCVAGKAARDPFDAAHNYAQTLLKLAEGIAPRPMMSLAASTGLVGIVGVRAQGVSPGFFGNSLRLKRRLRMITDFSPAARRFGLAGPLVAMVLAGCALTGANGGTPSTEPPTTSSSPAAPKAPATQPTASVRALIQKTKLLTSEGKYREAFDVTTAILKIDPTNDYANGIRPVLEDKANFAEQKGNPAKRDGDESKEDRAVQAQLDRTLPEVAFDGVGFTDVIDFLRDVSGANIFVNWKSLEAAGIDRNAPISAKMRNVKFGKALYILLDSLGGGKTKLSYMVDNGVITISTLEDITAHTPILTRVYDIRDLITPIPNYASDDHAAPHSPTTQPAAIAKPENAPTRQELLNSITRLIKDSIAPETWTPEHGGIATIREFDSQLIIAQTAENHVHIKDLIELLRKSRSLQITVETRFISCDDQLVRNLVQKWGNAAQKVETLKNNLPNTVRPTTSEMVGVYLTPAQLEEFLRATEPAVRSPLISAPRITLFSGQRAFVTVARTVSYVRDFSTTRTATGELRFDPVFGQVDPGTTLDVQATASADRKYATLMLRPKASVLREMKSIDWTGRPAGSNLHVQEPDIRTSELQTTVNIPDNGVLLLGGMEDPGIGENPPATQPAGNLRGLFILVKPTIIQKE